MKNIKRCHTISILNDNITNISRTDFLKLMTDIYKEMTLVDEILISKEMYSFFENMGKDFFDETSIKQMNNIGIYGNLWGASIKIIKNIKHIIFIGETDEISN